jgi:hypothetical protein
MRVAYTLALVLAMSMPARAEPLEVGSKHERIWLKRDVGKRKRYIRLKPDEVLVFRVSGPANLGLRCRELWIGKEAVPPVYLTVVRDHKEQGTVRFILPRPDGARIAEHSEIQVSGEVLVKIEIPEGAHEYHLLVSGPQEGILLQPFLGIKAKEKVIVATPGAVSGREQAEETRVPPKETVQAEKRPAVLAPPSMDILAPVELSPGGEERGVIHQTIIRHRPGRIGPGTRTAGTVAAMFLLGSASLLVSGAVQEQRAENEPVQIPAGELFDRAEKTYQASYVLGGLTAAAVLATLVFYLVEEPDADEHGVVVPGGVEVRF